MEAYDFLQKHFVGIEKRQNHRILKQNIIMYILLVVSKAASSILK